MASHYSVIMDHKMNMDKQIESMYKKANKKVGIMSRIRMFISCNSILFLDFTCDTLMGSL